MSRLDKCPCGSGDYPDATLDGYGIFMFYSCRRCFAEKRSHYRDDVLEKYETDEQIEDDY